MSRVLFLVAEDVELLDLAGPVQAFHEARAAGARYEVSFVGEDANGRSAQGFAFTAIAPFPGDVRASDLVIVSGSARFRDRRWIGAHRATVDWIRAAYDCGATVASVCVGSFLLGAAGILDGKQATTHWNHVERLAQRFPRARVIADRLYVFDGRIATSAGIASGIDLALALIERDQSPRVAAAVARMMVVSVRRPGTGEQLSPYFANREHMNHEVHLVQDYLVEHVDETVTLDALADHAAVSVRTLTRLFRAATGTTIKAYATALRLERARELIQTGSLTIDAVAERCGFADGRHLRRLWKDRYGYPPGSGRLQDGFL